MSLSCILAAYLMRAETLIIIFVLCTLAACLMCANWYLSWLLTCIGGIPYVCSHIILLSTPTLANVTKIAHRERVPNGTLPKLGRVLTPLWGKATPSSKKKRLWWRCASLLHQLICHHENLLLPWSVFVWQALCRKKFIGQATFIFKIIYLELLENCHRSYYVNQELFSFI